MSEAEKIPVVILCGGRGTRLREGSGPLPKPLVPVGNKPILWHIMKSYAHHGFEDFVLCLGYKGDSIKEYFINYEMMNSNFTVRLGRRSPSVELHEGSCCENWSVSLIDTGEEAMTGARVHRVRRHVGERTFMLTYGDGVSDVDIGKLLAFHRSHGKLCTVTGVHPAARFGELVVDGDEVVEFAEKPQVQSGFINGGFFVCEPGFFDYVSDSDDCVLERQPLERLSRDGQLRVFRHEGFWQCMDTYRDMKLLNDIWQSGEAPWKVWK